MPTDSDPSLLVEFQDERVVGWHQGEFYGDESTVARAIIRCESMFSAPFGNGSVMAESYSIEGALVAILGSTEKAGVAITSTSPVVFKESVLAATIGTWH